MRIGARQLFGVGIVASIIWAASEVQGGRAQVSNSIPNVSSTAVNAYIAAADYANAKIPDCGIDWHLIAAIGAVESGHGTYGDSELDVDGVANPPIRGPRLDGGEFAKILDTDNGVFDGDKEYDRAVGPMQFIPSTWMMNRPSETSDPQNIKDASKATGNLLCDVASPLSDPDNERKAIYAYNHSNEYVEVILKFKNDFITLAPGGAAGTGEITAGAVAAKLGREGRDRWESLGRIIDDVPGEWLDTGFEIVDPAVSLLWTTLDHNSAGTAARLGLSSNANKIVETAESWVDKSFNPGRTAQCAYFVRHVLEEAGVKLSPELTGETLDQWSSGGLGAANSFGGDQGAVVEDVENLRPGDIVMFANTYGDWPTGTITHVGIIVEVKGEKASDVWMVDRPTASQPVKRRTLSGFDFVGAIRI